MALISTLDVTEQLLQQYLPSVRVSGITDKYGPGSRNMSETLFNVEDEALADCFKNE